MEIAIISAEFAELLEVYISIGIFLVAAALGVLSFLAWRRERVRRMRVVAVGYGMFAVYGFAVFLLDVVLFAYFPDPLIELLEHAIAILILGGLLTFFVALTRE